MCCHRTMSTRPFEAQTYDWLIMCLLYIVRISKPSKEPEPKIRTPKKLELGQTPKPEGLEVF